MGGGQGIGRKCECPAAVAVLREEAEDKGRATAREGGVGLLNQEQWEPWKRAKLGWCALV